jgi:hypothetical protein
VADAIEAILASGSAGLVDARIDPTVNAWTHPALTRTAAATDGD